MRAGTWADRAEASWLSNELRNMPHIPLECGHLSPPGSGPLAEAGRGYCRYHGVTRVAPPASGGLNESRADEHGTHTPCRTSAGGSDTGT